MKQKKRFSGSLCAQVDMEARRIEFVLQTGESAYVFPMNTEQAKELAEELTAGIRLLEAMRFRPAPRGNA